jgi:hypothetical protein
MDTILIIITGISLALAAAMGGLLARALREERRRSEARVMLLTQLAAQRAGDLDLRPAATAAMLGADLFHEHQEPSAWPRRLAAVGAMAVLIVIIGFGWNVARHHVPSPAAARPPAITSQPLELLSLRHQQERGSLTITGLVQNPRAGAPMSHVQATVSVFGADGALLTSSRGPLDVTSLAPGDESAFTVRVPIAAPVARYRVSFRGENDRAVGHVDRRNRDAIARKEGS